MAYCWYWDGRGLKRKYINNNASLKPLQPKNRPSKQSRRYRDNFAVMLAIVNRFLEWVKSLFWKEEMELTLVGLQYSGKTTLVNVIAVSILDSFYFKYQRIMSWTWHLIISYIWNFKLLGLGGICPSCFSLSNEGLPMPRPTLRLTWPFVSFVFGFSFLKCPN